MKSTFGKLRDTGIVRTQLGKTRIPVMRDSYRSLLALPGLLPLAILPQVHLLTALTNTVASS